MPETDRAAILENCQLLCEPGGVVELRALDAVSAQWAAPHTIAGYFTELPRLAAAAAGLQARGVYLTLNPVAPALLSRALNRVKDCRKGDPLTGDADVVRRRWLPVDLDAVRPSGISATDAEHALALARAREVADWLAAQGWPAPVLADSGNGAHLLYRVDLPAADGGAVRDALAALAHRFTDALVRVDAENYNPARIWKLYGTLVRKGDATADRPHRLSRVLAAPAEPAVVDAALLAALAARCPPTAPAASRAQAACLQAACLQAGPTSTWRAGSGTTAWRSARRKSGRKAGAGCSTSAPGTRSTPIARPTSCVSRTARSRPAATTTAAPAATGALCASRSKVPAGTGAGGRPRDPRPRPAGAALAPQSRCAVSPRPPLRNSPLPVPTNASPRTPPSQHLLPQRPPFPLCP